MKLINAQDLHLLQRAAVESPRRRAHRNIHEQLEANVQRLFIAMQPETYVRPHRHSQAHKWELFLLLEGAVSLLVFTEDGELRERIELGNGQNRMVEIPPFTWHTLVCQLPDTLVFEVKEGAYIPMDDKDFAPWAPLEGDAAVAQFHEQLRWAKPGDRLGPLAGG